MRADYERAEGWVLQEEGGYTNNPSDPGGPTNWGITIKDARLYWKPNATAQDVRDMPKSVAMSIYRTKYWNALRCDDLPAGVDYAVMDYGVNSGIGRAGKVLRRALKLDDSTYKVTDDVIAAAFKANSRSVVAYVCDERLSFLQSLKTYKVFGKGWASRVSRVKARSLQMIGVNVVVPDTKIDASAKGSVPVNKAARNVSSGSVASGTVVAAQQSTDPTIAIIILVIGLLVAGGLFWYFHWKRNKQQEAAVPVIISA